MVVLAGHQGIEASRHRVGVGVRRTELAGLRALGAGAGGHIAAAIGVVGLAVQIGEVHAVGQPTRRIHGALVVGMPQSGERRHRHRRKLADRHLPFLLDHPVGREGQFACDSANRVLQIRIGF